jgi:hypothetical protein
LFEDVLFCISEEFSVREFVVICSFLQESSGGEKENAGCAKMAAHVYSLD